MDSKSNKILAVVIVIIILAAAIAIVFMVTDNDDEKSSKGSGRVLVYGNADNDDYLDDEDLEMIQSIVDSGAWDKKTYPLADANYDGVVNSDDVDYLQKILNKEKVKMYYIGSSGDTFYFNYPSTGRDIAASSDYGLMLTQVLGIYDRVVAGSSNRVLTLDESRYPGCQSFTNLGSYASGDYPTFVESFLASGCTILLGQVTESVYDLIHESGATADLILLSPSAEIQEGGIDVVTSILTAGILLDCGDAARGYANYCDDMVDYISSNIEGETTISFVCAYNTDNAVTTTVHTTDGRDGAMTGIIWTLSFLPMYSEVPWNELDTNGRSLNVEIEYIAQLDPDIIILCMWGKVDTDGNVAEAQAMFDETAKYFSQTNAYKNGKIYGVSYETWGTYLGVGGLALLCSYIWPGSFDENEGWNNLQYVIDTYTLIDADVKTLGGVIPYKVNCS